MNWAHSTHICLHLPLAIHLWSFFRKKYAFLDTWWLIELKRPVLYCLWNLCLLLSRYWLQRLLDLPPSFLLLLLSFGILEVLDQSHNVSKSSFGFSITKKSRFTLCELHIYCCCCCWLYFLDSQSLYTFTIIMSQAQRKNRNAIADNQMLVRSSSTS